MAADDKSKKGENGAAKAAPAGEPSVKVLGQYIKDLSFENPNAPASFQPQTGEQPTLDVSLNVAVRLLGDNLHEVTLNVENKLAGAAGVLFQLQLAYAGAFQIENVPNDIKDQLLRIQCPTLLFPFVRRLVADLTRDGGFPSLFLDPVDFGQLYMQEMNKQKAAGTA
jgi:preprotein translocase subunit SecB